MQVGLSTRRAFSRYFTLLWMLGSVLFFVHRSIPERNEGDIADAPSYKSSIEDNAFLPEEGACDARWTSWPQVQERAIADGNVMVWRMTASVGNIMRALTFLVPLARLLEVGFIINSELFPAFRTAFEPGLIKWDLDPKPFFQRASGIERGIGPDNRHALMFRDGFMILSDLQLELLVAIMEDDGRSNERIKKSFGKQHRSKLRNSLLGAKLDPALPCAWNILFRRSTAMVASMEAHSPWGTTRNPIGTHRRYNAWHIRTSEGENAEWFNPAIHTYIFHDHGSADVCPIYLSTIDIVNEACPTLATGGTGDVPVYISSNSKSMAKNCSVFAGAHNVEAGFADLGIDARYSHTAFSKDPNTATQAFIDFLYLMDASVVIRTTSSFSRAGTDMKGFNCSKINVGGQLVSKISMCLPPACVETTL